MANSLDDVVKFEKLVSSSSLLPAASIVKIHGSI